MKIVLENGLKEKKEKDKKKVLKEIEKLCGRYLSEGVIRKKVEKVAAILKDVGKKIEKDVGCDLFIIHDDVRETVP